MELSIGELARRTGVPVATLRAWESRYGQPQALPRDGAPGGHRRYDEAAVATVRDIVELRDAGLTLGAAVDAVASPSAGSQSVFVALREQHPEVPVSVLLKPTVLSLTHAIEDEYVARSSHSVLFACFQRGQFFEQSETRWQELSEIADAAVVFADFDGYEVPPPDPGDRLLHIDLEPGSPLLREWLIVCDDDDYPVCMAARELLGESGPQRSRQFQTLWTLDPVAVRSAARLCAGHVATRHPEVAARLTTPLRRLQDPPPAASSDLQRATTLFGRLVAYVEAGH